MDQVFIVGLFSLIYLVGVESPTQLKQLEDWLLLKFFMVAAMLKIMVMKSHILVFFALWIMSKDRQEN